MSDDLGGGQTFRSWISEIYCFIRYGCSPDDYFRYEFYRKSGFERDRFITYRRSQALIKRFNDPSKTHYFRDKRDFNKIFHSFIKREWIDLSKCTKEEFEKFFLRQGAVLMKPLDGGQGKGIFKLTSLNGFRIEDYKDFIAEEDPSAE